MMRPSPFHEQHAPQRVPNDGEPTLFASPDRRAGLPTALTQETKINDRNRGLFAIADGATSPIGGAAAGLTVAAELERQLGAVLDTKLENLAASHATEERRRVLAERLVEQSIELAFMEAHRRLTIANRENPALRLRSHATVARMVDLPFSQKELFFALSGKERLYLVRDGQVSRLGEQGHAAMVDPGVLGEDVPMTMVQKQMLEPGDRLVLLGDGAVGIVRGSTVEDTVKQFGGKGPRAVERALQEFAKGKIEDPQNPDAKAGEISAVCWEAFPMLKKTALAENYAMELDARRPVLQVRLRKIAADIERTKVLAKPDASGRQLIGAEETLVRLEAEHAAVTLELLNLDIPPRFSKGDHVSLAGAMWEVKDLSEGKYILRNARTDQTWLPSRWEFEKSVPVEELPVRPGDRIRVSGFTATQKDDWHIMDTTQPADRFLFEDGAQDKHMAVPAGLTRQALHDMISEGRTLQNQAFALKRHAEKTDKKK